jgi:pimeloyl-ACP methyl ester carboxylesterase
MVLNNPSDLSLQFAQASDLVPGEQERYLGSFGTPTLTSDGAIQVDYTHPRDVHNDSLFSQLTLEIGIETNDASFEAMYPIHIYRAPVMMIHGLWSDASAFKAMDDELMASGKWPSDLVHRADYKSTNDEGFQVNVWKADVNLFQTVAQAVLQGRYSAGRADVVAHSMGGLLTRFVLQNESYPASGEVRRLITLNTPHAGSQGANAILECETLQLLLDNIGKSATSGAVRDLSVGSDALAILNGSALNRNVVPSHALYTTSDIAEFSNDPSLSPWIAEVLQEWCGYAFPDAESLLSDLYDGEPNDLIVPLSSQLGGLTGTATSLQADQPHVGASSNPSVISRVMELLDLDSEDPQFSSSGYSPPNLTFDFPESSSLRRKSNAVTVNITSPVDGTVVSPGETVTVTVTGTVNVTDLISALSGTGDQFERQIAENTSSANFTFAIPDNASGPLRVGVVGVDEANSAGGDNITLFVEPEATLDSIDVDPAWYGVPVGGSDAVPVIGYYDDGIPRSLSGFPGLTVSISDGSIADSPEDGVVRGLTEDTTEVTVSYSDRTATAELIVFAPELLSVGPDDPLPVELTSFDATLHNDEVYLMWQTASETDNAGFGVQRRIGKQGWAEIGFIEGSGTTAELSSYRFVDRSIPYEGDQLVYRLEQVDNDGTASVSNEITVRRSVNRVELLAPFPNPARNQVTIRYAVPERTEVTISVYDALGRLVQILAEEESNGRKEMKVDANRLASGTYFVRLEAGSEVKVHQLTVVR